MRGFTLIELLVVIAIIGVISSVALASLSTTRLKAADATIRTEATQLRTILNEEYAETGSYTAIKHGSLGSGSSGTWFQLGDTCPTANFLGNYASQASSVCTSLVKAAAVSACGTACVFFNNTSPDSPTSFTIMVYLPGASAQAGAARYLCYGSSGKTSVSAADWTQPGCWQNP